jgi:hypothetical protein
VVRWTPFGWIETLRRELIQGNRFGSYRPKALHEGPIECKDLLKERGYRWNGGEDGRRAPGIAIWTKTSWPKRSGSWPRRSTTAAIVATSSSGSTTATDAAIGFDHAATASRSPAISP